MLHARYSNCVTSRHAVVTFAVKYNTLLLDPNFTTLLRICCKTCCATFCTIYPRRTEASGVQTTSLHCDYYMRCYTSHNYLLHLKQQVTANVSAIDTTIAPSPYRTNSSSEVLSSRQQDVTHNRNVFIVGLIKPVRCVDAGVSDISA